MPKIPTYISEGGLSGAVQPTPRQWPDVNKPITDLVQVGVDAAGAFVKARETARQADEKLDMELQFNRMKEDIAVREINLKRQGMNPDNYPDALEKEMTQALQTAEQSLKFPESKAKFRGLTGGWFTGKIVDGRFDAEKIRHGQMEATAAISNRNDANAAVFGTPEEQEAALGRFAARTQYLVNVGVYSGAKAGQVTQGFLDDVETGAATRDFKDPKLRPAVEANLMRGAYKLPPDKQMALLKTLQTEARGEETRQREELERQRQERADTGKKAARDFVSARQYDEASKVLDAYRDDFKGNEYNDWRNIVEKAKTDTPSDPATRLRISRMVYRAETPEEASRAQQALDAARAAGLINFTDGDKYDNDLQGTKQAAKNRREDKALDERERQHSETRRVLTEDLRIQSAMSPAFNQQAQTILALAEDDLARHRNDADGGAAWWRKEKNLYIGRIPQAAQSRVNEVKKLQKYQGSDQELLNSILTERDPNRKAYLKTQAALRREEEELMRIMGKNPETPQAKPEGGSRYIPAPPK